jgi:hypothetical protein
MGQHHQNLSWIVLKIVAAHQQCLHALMESPISPAVQA